ncbi:MAG: chromosome segregation protein SMC [Clostridia bacterium]
MYFKQIELLGFKSFADKTEINFDHGVTAIVGPNGCGKSNVSDAIRWVLGEQRAKELRGQNMQDVIFSGTEKRRSLSYCEATLVFDNVDRFFDYDYNELAITRKLYKSGESEYSLNRTKCRLKDITNILFDSGIGRDGYSIISQGQVEQIINSKPEGRRGIFEEAAGISKYRSRKEEAENKLKNTRDVLMRVKDILTEVENRLGPLKQQAEDAKKYLIFKANLKDLEINQYVYQYDTANQQKQKMQIKLDGIKEEISSTQNLLETITKKFTDNLLGIDNIDAEIEKVHSKVLAITVEIEKQSGEVRLIRERLNSLKQTNQMIELDISENKSKLETDKKQLENVLILNKTQKSDLEVLEQTETELSNKHLETLDNLNLLQGESEKSQKSLIDEMEKFADLKSNLSGLQAEQDAQLENQKRIEHEFDIQNKKLLLIKTDISSIQKKVKELEINKEKSSKDLASAKFRLQSVNDESAEEESNKHDISVKIQVYENRRRLLADMESEFEGYAYAVKKLLKESVRNPNLKNEMIGVLASLITVPEKYETAIEVALGNALQNIVTLTENNAKHLIEFLKQNNFGRATFLPISAMREKGLRREESFLLTENGCFGVASELIKFNPQISSVILNLLGTTLIVNNLDTAILLASKCNHALKIVTLDGDVLNPAGSMTGGSKKNEASNLISRSREIESLGKEIEELRKLLAESHAKILSLLKEQNVLKTTIENLENEKNFAEICFAKESEKSENFIASYKDLEVEILKLNSQKSAYAEKIEYISLLISKLDGSGSQSNVNAGKKLEERQQKTAELRLVSDEILKNLTTVKINKASLIQQVDANNSTISRLDFDISILTQKLEGLKNELTKNLKLVLECEKLAESAMESQASDENKFKLENIRQSQIALENKKSALQQENKQLDEQRMSTSENLSNLNNKKFNQEMQLGSVDTNITAMQERIFEDYELTYSGCVDFKRADFEPVEGAKEINRIKREISKLGYVNVSAIEESKLVLERYESLSGQATDLTVAEENTTKIIDELKAEMTAKFDAEFKKISANFEVTFKELFGGGRAKLELVSSSDMLEAGVEITAQPPGKNLQNISLLSGGEKALTAIAILFSILKLKPLPFCLLDEIDAALDEANVDRFAQYLKRFSKSTQFIVITHKKPTMELADTLFGVTMEEKGVSTTVSVKIADAIKVAQA